MGLNILVTTTTDATFNGRLLYTWLMWFLYSVGTMMNPSDKSSPMSDVKVSLAIGCMSSNRNYPINILNGLVTCSYLYDIPGFENDGRIHKMKFVVSYPDVRRLLFLHALSQTGNYDAIIYADLDAFFVRNPLPELINYQKEDVSVAFSRAAYTTNLPCNGFQVVYDRTLTNEYIKYGYYSQNQIGENWFKSALELLQKDNKNLFPYINNTYENETHRTPIMSFTIPKLKSDSKSVLKLIHPDAPPSLPSPVNNGKFIANKNRFRKPSYTTRYVPTQLNNKEYSFQENNVWKIRFLDGWNYYRGLCHEIPSYSTIVHCQSAYFDSTMKSLDLDQHSLLLPFTDSQINSFLGHRPKTAAAGKFGMQIFIPSNSREPKTINATTITVVKNFSDVFIPDLKNLSVQISEFYMRDTNTLAIDDKMKYEIKINTFQFRPDLDGYQLGKAIESLPGWKSLSKRYNLPDIDQKLTKKITTEKTNDSSVRSSLITFPFKYNFPWLLLAFTVIVLIQY
jgi:hypothetical protein